jgi:hypothetical protein
MTRNSSEYSHRTFSPQNRSITSGVGRKLVQAAGWYAARPFEGAVRDAVGAQLGLLRRLMQRNRDTDYGRRYAFRAVHTMAEYRRAVPATTYEDLRPDIERVLGGDPGVLTADKVVMFAQTSGTTAAPKYIPVTATCRRNSGMTVWFHYASREHPGILQGKVLTIVAPAVEGWTKAGIPYGSTSGMAIRELPTRVKNMYSVPYDAFEISDYHAKYYVLLRFSLEHDVSLVATADPSSILKLAEMASDRSELLIKDIHDGTLSDQCEVEPALRVALEKLLSPNAARAHELDLLRRHREGRLCPADYWPNVALLGCWKGGTVEGYIDRLRSWYDPDGGGMPPVRELGYLASEARMSIPVDDHGAGGVLTVHMNLFEFVPLTDVESYPDQPERWTFLAVDELEVGSEYYVFVSTTGGLYRYDMNDVIEVVGRHHTTPMVAFRRKGRGTSNITGEKLTVNQVIQAVAGAGKAAGLSAMHFRAEPDYQRHRYVFKVEFADWPAPETLRAWLAALDRALGEINLAYAQKRGNERLAPPLLHVMRHGWHERGKERLVSQGRRLFQAQSIILDGRSGFHPEPEELESMVHLPPRDANLRRAS